MVGLRMTVWRNTRLKSNTVLLQLKKMGQGSLRVPGSRCSDQVGQVEAPFGERKMRALKILGVFYRTSRDGDDRGVKFPDSGDVRGAAGVVKVFKGHTQDRYWQRLRQFTAVLGVESEAVFHQLGLRSLAGAAKLAVHDGLHNHPGIVLSVVIEISKCTSQSVPFKLAFCRNAVATHPLR